MSFFGKFYDRKSLFRDHSSIVELIGKNPKKDDLKTLKIFETPKQRTYLINDGVMVYCILDDVRNIKPKLAWKAPRKTFIKNGKLSVDFNPRDKTAKTGVIDIGKQHKGWLYSKSLISPESLKEQFTNLLKKADFPETPHGQ